MNHCSTIEERISMVSQMLARPTHGLVTQLSRTSHVSRQTLYRWQAMGRQALQEALAKQALPVKATPSVRVLVLNLLLEAHASYRDIQATLRSNHGIEISLGSIAAMVKEAGQRAQEWMKQQQAQMARVLVLDEQYSSQRGKAYPNVIDVHSGQVWASVPPVQVDGESWTLVWWSLQEQGLSCAGTGSSGGRAIADALSQVQSEPPTRCVASLPCGGSSPGTAGSSGGNGTRALVEDRAAHAKRGAGKTRARHTSQGSAWRTAGAAGSDELCRRQRALSLSAMAQVAGSSRTAVQPKRRLA